MTTPSTLETRATDITAALQDYARDLEARLAVISRNRFANPNDYAAMGFAQPARFADTADPGVANIHLAGVGVANAHLQATVLERYWQGAGSAVQPLNGHDTPESPLTDSERTAFEAARTLSAAIVAVSSLSEASALVATFTS